MRTRTEGGTFAREYPIGRVCEICRGPIDGRDHPGRRRFCSSKCAGAATRKPDHELGWSAAHKRARELCPRGPCARCGKADASDVHHRDRNHQNNAEGNLERICRGCHIKEHQPRARCAECGKPAHARRLCNRHYLMRKKLGQLPPGKDLQPVSD